MSLPVIVWVFQHSTAKLGARLTLLALAEFAHDDGSKAFPTVETLMERTLLSERGVRDGLRKLEADGHIARTGQTQAGVNVYRVIMGANSAPGGGKIRPDRGANSAPNPTTGPASNPNYDLVRTAWSERVPPLIAHRATYLTSKPTTEAIKRALVVYDAEAIASAISNYATVLGGADYRWDYSWTLRDFLQRGLDRFVDESKPLINFRSRDRPGSSADLSSLADL